MFGVKIQCDKHFYLNERHLFRLTQTAIASVQSDVNICMLSVRLFHGTAKTGQPLRFALLVTFHKITTFLNGSE